MQYPQGVGDENLQDWKMRQTQQKWAEVAAEMKTEADGRDSERGGGGSSGTAGWCWEAVGEWGGGGVQRVVSCTPLTLRVCHCRARAARYPSGKNESSLCQPVCAHASSPYDPL